jgi:arsenite methyltransferase
MATSATARPVASPPRARDAGAILPRIGAIVAAVIARDDSEFAAALDEAPLWSAPFGLALLEAVPLEPEAAVLDLGCGTGFPLLEMAHRLGPRARLLGVDPWAAVLGRARAKCRAQGLANVLLLRATAERLPIRDGAIDLVVSNNGLNNVQDVAIALRECARVSRPGGRLAFTMNLPETMRGFYDVLEETLASRGLGALRPAVTAHIRAKRPPVGEVEAAVSAAGFDIDGRRFGRFTLRFASSAALFSHWLIRIGFLEPWREIVPPAERDAVFAEVARRLDAAIRPGEGLSLDVPFACWTATKH